jgi:hypothetical protein
MKKRIFSFIFAALLLLAAFYLPVSGSAENKSAGLVNMTVATDEFLGKFDSYDTFYGSQDNIVGNIVFWTETEIKDFKVIEITWDIDDWPMKLYVGKTLYKSDKLSPEKPLLAQMMIEGPNDYFPVAGISCTDQNGVKKYYYIPTSASADYMSLVEFTPENGSPKTGGGLLRLFIVLGVSVSAATAVKIFVKNPLPKK